MQSKDKKCKVFFSPGDSSRRRRLDAEICAEEEDEGNTLEVEIHLEWILFGKTFAVDIGIWKSFSGAQRFC